MQYLHHNHRMNLDVRRTTPFTTEDYEQVRAFADAGTPEHDALEQVTPVPLREGSEGSTLRALTLLGMAYVREHAAHGQDLAAGYADLADERAAMAVRPGAGLRANMARRAQGSALAEGE